MASYSTTPEKSKSTPARLKLVGKTPTAKLHLGASPPPAEMKPGDYLARCETAWTEPIGKQTRAVWQFHIHESQYHGTGLRKWLVVADASGEVPVFGEYAKACEIALGRPLTEDDDIANPAEIFAGKIFRVFVGYRKTELPKGGQASDKNALTKKDDQDRLKVHAILARVDL